MQRRVQRGSGEKGLGHSGGAGKIERDIARKDITNVYLMEGKVRESLSYCSCDGNEWKEIT